MKINWKFKNYKHEQRDANSIRGKVNDTEFMLCVGRYGEWDTLYKNFLK